MRRGDLIERLLRLLKVFFHGCEFLLEMLDLSVVVVQDLRIVSQCVRSAGIGVVYLLSDLDCILIKLIL
jgi:hypothetical protein